MNLEGDSILVIGGGVFGLAASIELCRRGWFVRLFDGATPPNPAASSTDISKVVRMDYGDDDFYTDLAELAIRRWREWNSRLGEPVYHECGFLLLTRPPMSAGSFEGDAFERLVRRGYRPRRVDEELLRNRFPLWSGRGYADGYFNPCAGWTPSGRVVALMADQARRAGARLQRSQVVQLREAGSRITGVVTADGSCFSGARVLVTGGAWTPELLPELGETMWATGQPVFHFAPVAGERFRAQHFPVWACDISRTGWYGFPINEDGVLKIANHGAGRTVKAGETIGLEDADVEACRAFLRETLPALADAPLVGGRLCLYCDTPEGDFRIAEHPERAGLYIAAGGSGHAFKFAPVIGEIIADVVEGRPNPWSSRFAWSAPRGGRSERARRSDPA